MKGIDGTDKNIIKLLQNWSIHTLSDLIMGILDNGMAIELLSEHERDISEGHGRQEKLNAGIPLSFILIGRKN